MPPAPKEDNFALDFDTGGGSGSGSGSSGGGHTPQFTDPGDPVSLTSSYIYGDVAKLLEAIKPDPLYSELRESAETATAACTDVEDSAGLISCGRNTNDPDTDWNECDKCDFFSISLALQMIAEFLVKIVGIFAFLIIILGQLLVMTSVGASDKMARIKSVLWSALLGFAYVLAVWIVIHIGRCRLYGSYGAGIGIRCAETTDSL